MHGQSLIQLKSQWEPISKCSQNDSSPSFTQILATQFLKNLRGTDYVQLINFQDPIFKRVVYHTLTIFNLAQKLEQSQYICGQSQNISFPFPFLKNLRTTVSVEQISFPDRMYGEEYFGYLLTYFKKKFNLTLIFQEDQQGTNIWGVQIGFLLARHAQPHEIMENTEMFSLVCGYFYILIPCANIILIPRPVENLMNFGRKNDNKK